MIERRVMNGCSTKKRYETEQHARDVGTKVWYRRGHHTRVYECELCGGWHLTSTNAEPKMKPGWRLPEVSQREQSRMRKQQRRRR